MTYGEAVGYLAESYTLGSKKGHENLLRLLYTFGNPQDKLKIIHIAGTNGKGSACAFTASVLKQAGFRAGVFTSPHLQRYNERFSIGDKHISDDDFAYWVGRVKEHTAMVLKQDEHFSFFEILTVVAFNYFFEEKVDFVILETGLGGRLDATNVIKKPLLSVITMIGLDHTEYLGNKIEEITAEKSEIIKKNCSTVLFFQSDKVYNIIRKKCVERDSGLYYYENGFNYEIVSEDLRHTQFMLDGEPITINMTGEYQISNAINSLLIFNALRDLGVSITRENIIKGLYNAFIPGRMEIIRENPMVLIDGAHNIDGAGQLNKFLKKRKNGNVNVIVVLGMLKDKAYQEMAEKILEYSSSVIVTAPINKRALQSYELYENIKTLKSEITEEQDCYKAYELALKKADENDLVVCTGSLYLVGDIRNYEKGRVENDRL